MKTFYLLRNEDLHGHAGTGVVAEGIIFDNGACAMIWLSETFTVTVFQSIMDVEKLHSHDGRTEVIKETKDERFNKCKFDARLKKRVLGWNKRKKEIL